MFTDSFQLYSLFFILCFSSSNTFAEVYKWVDDQGQTHYSQQAPKNKHAQIIKAPPPPAINPRVAQKEINLLIEHQQGVYAEREEDRRLEEEERLQKEKQEKYCNVNQNNLQEYINNPGRRMIDADGNVTRPTEQQRQTKIKDIEQRLQEHCL